MEQLRGLLDQSPAPLWKFLNSIILLCDRRFDAAAREAMESLDQWDDLHIAAEAVRAQCVDVSEAEVLCGWRSPFHATYVASVALVSSGRLDDASTLLQRSAREDPDASGWIAPWMELLRSIREGKDRASRLYKDGQFRAAAEAYRSCRDATSASLGAPVSVLASNEVAAWRASGENERAKLVARAALQDAPFHAKSWLRLARLVEQEGDRPDATRACLSAAQWLDPLLFDSTADSLERAFRATGATSRVRPLSSEEDLLAAQKTCPGPLLVDFFAPWCKPCRDMEPLIDQLSIRCACVTVAKVDGDALSDAAIAAEVRAFPTLQMWWRGRRLETIEGANLRGVYASLTSALRAMQQEGPSPELDTNVADAVRAAAAAVDLDIEL